MDSELGQVTILEDIDENWLQQKIPEIAKKYLESLKEAMDQSFKIAIQNRDLQMDISKINYDRKIKKASYQVGEYVLCDHPRVKKGTARGISHKYYGPFEIKKSDTNGVDYYIQRAGTKKAKIYKVHQNRLKMYQYDQEKKKQIEENETTASEEEQANKKRKYIKDINNPRWKKKLADDDESSNESNTSEKSDISHQSMQSRSEKVAITEKPNKKRKYTKNMSNPRWQKKIMENKTSTSNEKSDNETTAENESDKSQEPHSTSKGKQKQKTKKSKKLRNKTNEITKETRRSEIKAKNDKNKINKKNEPKIKDQNLKQKRTREIKEIKDSKDNPQMDQNNDINGINNNESLEKNIDEQHLKNNCKYNLRSKKKPPDKDQDKDKQNKSSNQ